MTEPAAGAAAANAGRAWPNMRQELLAPVTALVGYGELLTEEGRAPGAGRPCARTFERILTAAQDLLGLVNRLLDEAAAPAQAFAAPSSRRVQSKMRHDLRNPLNAIKGYAELLLEELDELGGAAIRARSRGVARRMRRACWRGST